MRYSLAAILLSVPFLAGCELPPRGVVSDITRQEHPALVFPVLSSSIDAFTSSGVLYVISAAVFFIALQCRMIQYLARFSEMT